MEIIDCKNIPFGSVLYTRHSGKTRQCVIHAVVNDELSNGKPQYLCDIAGVGETRINVEYLYHRDVTEMIDNIRTPFAFTADDVKQRNVIKVGFLDTLHPAFHERIKELLPFLTLQEYDEPKMWCWENGDTYLRFPEWHYWRWDDNGLVTDINFNVFHETEYGAFSGCDETVITF